VSVLALGVLTAYVWAFVGGCTASGENPSFIALHFHIHQIAEAVRTGEVPDNAGLVLEVPEDSRGP
jgi:hypothetical protein